MVIISRKAIVLIPSLELPEGCLRCLDSIVGMLSMGHSVSQLRLSVCVGFYSMLGSLLVAGKMASEA